MADKIEKPKCTYCLKSIVAKWNNRKNGRLQVDTPSTQQMHLKCWKENDNSWILPTEKQMYERIK